MERRRLKFDRFEAVAADIQNLHTRGYTQLGDWNLSQMCDHLTRFMRMSLEGFPFQLTWIVRRVVGPLVLKPLVLGTGWIPNGAKAPQPLVSALDPQERAATHAAIEMLHRVRNHPGAFQPSPLFGRLTNTQWRRVHLIHSSHHLGFLVPHEAVPFVADRSEAFTADA